MLHVKPATGESARCAGDAYQISDDGQACAMREWEYSRRLKVEADSNGKIGYVHLQAMGPDDIDQWARDFYPVFDRQGLIIDVRHNDGGNIDSWLLGELLRKAWFYWQPRVGRSVVEHAIRLPRPHRCALRSGRPPPTAKHSLKASSAFKMGKVIGTRTWGGEIWLSGSNVQADNGVATAAEIGVYGPEGKWLIEGHGVEPDIVVDNLPHATFAGTDAQLQSAIDFLKQEIKADPRPVPPHPPYPDKSFKYEP